MSIINSKIFDNFEISSSQIKNLLSKTKTLVYNSQSPSNFNNFKPNSNSDLQQFANAQTVEELLLMRRGSAVKRKVTSLVGDKTEGALNESKNRLDVLNSGNKESKSNSVVDSLLESHANDQNFEEQKEFKDEKL